MIKYSQLKVPFFLSVIGMLHAFHSSAQLTGQAQGEESRYEEIKGYFKGWEIDSRHNLEKDTIFYINKKMLVYPSWYEDIIDTQAYIIIDYPSFNKEKKSSDTNTTQNSEAVRVQSQDTTVSGRKPVHSGLWLHRKKTIAILKKDFDKLERFPVYNSSPWFWKGYKAVTGQLTLPLKLRPKEGDQKFKITTDVTVGAYIGIRKRLAKRANIFITIPFSLGLSYININNGNTSNKVIEAKDDELVVPGITWATGFMVQIDRFNIGLLLGRDYASQVATDWIYHNKTWYSFGIGYSFSTGN